MKDHETKIEIVCVGGGGGGVTLSRTHVDGGRFSLSNLNTMSYL